MKSTDETSERGRLRAHKNINESGSFILLTYPEGGDGVEILTHMCGRDTPAFLGALQTAGLSLVKEAVAHLILDDDVTDLTHTLLADDDEFEVPDTIPTDWSSKAGMLPCGCLIQEDGSISKCSQHWAEDQAEAEEETP